MQEVLDANVVLAGDVGQGPEERRHFVGGAAEQVDQLFTGKAEPLEREVCQAGRVEIPLKRRELRVDLRGDQVLEAEAERFGDAEQFLGLREFFSRLDFGEVRHRNAGLGGQGAEGEAPGLTESGEFDAEHGSEVSGVGHRIRIYSRPAKINDLAKFRLTRLGGLPSLGRPSGNARRRRGVCGGTWFLPRSMRAS